MIVRHGPILDGLITTFSLEVADSGTYMLRVDLLQVCVTYSCLQVLFNIADWTYDTYVNSFGINH